MPQPVTPIETDLLVTHLDGQRRHVLGILEGLDEAALRRPVLPSGWSCLGLVRHLTEDVERFWFRCVMGGEPAAIAALSQGAEAWQVDPDVPAAVVLDRYRREIDRANAVIAATPLDAAPAWWPPDHFGDHRLASAREVILHVITETACHAGHLDAVRELIDGRTWLVIPT
ncbi:DinB family protein [Micromonospora sp. NPDC050495]|uniref:DinB family protein n=1 Tax=Micromonospora sp. NPDC050495 TaxID=3154936 RepID=UPI00340FDCF3